MVHYILGLDLGQPSEFSALAVLGVPSDRCVYTLPFLKRFPPATPYMRIAEALHELFTSQEISGSALVVDQTGVGRSIVNLVWGHLLGQVDATLVPVTLSCGHEIIYEHGAYLVPKKELIGTLQVLLQTRRLQVARGLDDAPTLIKELESYRVRVMTAGSETSDAWRDGAHDDLVFAVGLAAWFAERCAAFSAWERTA